MYEVVKIIKNLFREKINFVIFLLGLILLSNVFLYFYLNNNFTKIRKKIDHRYFNLTRTLEEIHDVKIDTYNGELKIKH